MSKNSDVSFDKLKGYFFKNLEKAQSNQEKVEKTQVKQKEEFDAKRSVVSKYFKD